MTENEKKAIVLVSGGLDSLLTEAKLLREDYSIYPFFVNYNQKALKQEKLAIMRFNTYLKKLYPKKIYNVKTTILGRRLFSNDKELITSSKSIPTSNSKEDFYVPMRNVIFISLASAYASIKGINIIATGSHLERPYAFPDSSPDFLLSIQNSLITGSHIKDFKIIAPFIEFYKESIIRWGYEHKLPLELTFSCYNNKDIHCGICKACKDRKESFKLANIEDKSVYEQ